MQTNQELMVYGGPLTAQDLRGRVNLIQEVMRSVMKEGVHYGVIPGCPKPSLFKPGAEVLTMTFSISVESTNVTDLSSHDEKRYRVTCTAYSSSGVRIGSAVGECSSSEEKYKWRAPVCDEEFEEADFDKKREKWKKRGWDKENNKPLFEKIRQVRTEPADLANTILQMADKRAFVAVVRKVTAASDIFTQDLEDQEYPVESKENDSNGGFKRPQPKQSSLNTADFKTITSKFETKCKSCGKDIPKGTDVLWNSKIKGAVYHPNCLSPKEEPKKELPKVTKSVLKNLEKMAELAGQKLIDRIGRDGLENLDQITPEIAQELLQEFSEAIDAQ